MSESTFAYGIHMAILLPMWGTRSSPQDSLVMEHLPDQDEQHWEVRGKESSRKSYIGRSVKLRKLPFPTNQIPGDFRNHSPGWHGRQSQSIEHSNGTITIMLHRIHSQGWRTRVGGSIPRRVHFLTTCASMVGRNVGKFLAMESKHLTPERVESCKHCGTKTQYCERSQKSPKREGGTWAWLPFSSLVEYRHSIRG